LRSDAGGDVRSVASTSSPPADGPPQERRRVAHGVCRLPEELRDRYALVVVGRLGLEDARGPFAEHATSLGISDRVVFTGHVDDGELVLLY
jgi:glycosyltransferase involved in cell wall biosynthesis